MFEILRFFVRKIHLWVYVLLMSISAYLTYQSNLMFEYRANDVFLELTGILSTPGQKWNKLMLLEQNNRMLLEENLKLRQERFENGKTIRRDFQILSAEIVSRYTSGFKNFIILDKGKDDGIRPNTGVWTSSGVVGIVTKVSPRFSKVFLLTHPEISISVKTGNPPKYGFTSRNKSRLHNLIRAVDFPDELNARKGDTVYTSGNSLIFPPDIPVGIITGFKKEGTETVMEIKPAADIYKIQYVYIGFNPLKDELNRLADE
jgi:rod shape-determining protein MreC